jgi:genome maintenance exonuclease 1
LAGIVDCIAVLGGLVCLIDWKTSEKAKLTLQSLYDAPLQLAAYIGNF